MSETKHTPGPWTWNDSGNCWLQGADGSTILHVDDYDNTCPHRDDANAHLIAAAPDLLKMLEDLRTHFVGLAAYLETCSTDVILDNLPGTIAHLKLKSQLIEDALLKAR